MSERQNGPVRDGAMTSANRVYLGLGSNLGSRQGNLLQALQYIQTRVTIKKVSSFYETEPVGYADQPKFLNAVCSAETELSPADVLKFLKWIEKRMGRVQSFRNAPRLIDLDLLLYNDITVTSEGLQVPHPLMHERAFVLVPLAEIAPGLVHPALHATVEEMLERAGSEGVRKVERCLRLRLEHDVQESTPSVPVGLSRAGVTNLRRIIHIANGGRGILFYAEMDLYADVKPEKAGIHMSRFSDVVESLAGEIVLEPSPDIETLAEKLARRIVLTQSAIRSEVHIRARSPMMRVTPISAKPVEEIYTLIGIASSTHEKTRRLVGVETEGMTVCPCAQDMVRTHSKNLLAAEGFSEEQAERIVEILPMASHNQRGRGTLLIGSEMQVRAEHLVYIVEASMSSETYELLKRTDEFFIVNKAHRNPRFAEDVVREMLRNVVEIYPDLPDDAFVLARQENFEGVHKHNAFAERFGALGEIRREMMGTDHVVRHMSLDEWLKG